MSMQHGYYIYCTDNGPLRDLPLAWFAYSEDAREWMRRHASASYPLEIKRADEKPVETECQSARPREILHRGRSGCAKS